MPLWVPHLPERRRDDSALANSAYDDGIEAARQGRPFVSNPYSGFLAGMWEDGFLLGLRELRGRAEDFSIPQQ